MKIGATLLAYYNKVQFDRDESGAYSAEFGGELPSSLVEELTEAGAEVFVYHLRRADASTVVMF
jgi:hypothetical protein